jgi:CysZ protein
MNTVLSAYMAALRDLWAPRMLAVMLIPPLAALLVWGVLAWALSDDWARWVADWIATSPWLAWVGKLGLSSVFIWGSAIMAFALLLPVMLITAVVVAEIVAMPIIVPWVSERRFPGLQQRKGGSMVGSAVNAITTIVTFAALWVVTLPLWFTGIGALVLAPVLSAYLNQRLFRYDALAEHASAEEYREIIVGAQGRLFLLGLMLALLYYVPFVNLAAPVLSALAFTHFCLGELARLRQHG